MMRRQLLNLKQLAEETELSAGAAEKMTQVICWDSGRPARNAPQARSLLRS